jgi:pilus assembly protein CpaC
MLGCENYNLSGYGRKLRVFAACAVISSVCFPFLANADSGLFLPLNRSSLMVLQSPIKEVVIANPDIVDVYAHNQTYLTFIGKTVGSTNVRLFDASGKLLKDFQISVGYDLPAIRKALKTFIPDETIGVEMVNTSVALTGQVRNNSTTDRALKIVQDYIGSSKSSAGSSALSSDLSGSSQSPNIINMMKLISGQQVMLRVRVAEVNRDALKRLGVDPQVILAGGNYSGVGALGTALTGIEAGGTAGSWTLPPDTYRGTFGGFFQSNGNHRVGAVINALERDGLFKTLAEPNLVAVSGESAEFLAGGEVPIPIATNGTSGGAATVTVEYKPYGVSVKFTPDVLSENRIRMLVQPEVSDVTFAQGVTVSGLPVPSIATRKVKTTVELAPGESFMIAGLLKDQTKATIDQLPGLKELPVLGALFRSTEFQRNESELVVSVTPYLVDPLKNSDVKLPTDNFKPASQMEMFFYGVLGAVAADGKPAARIPEFEGPTGFMVD